MSARLDAERIVASWLESQGPDDVPAWVVEAALAEARTLTQRPAWLAAIGELKWRMLAAVPRPAGRVAGLPVVRPRLATAWLLVLLAALLALLAGAWLIGSQPARVVPRVLACPPGSSPDQPGQVDQARPPTGDLAGPMVWDGAAGKLLLLPGGYTPAWTFDVCTNTWHEQAAETGAWWRPPGALVYDADSGLAVAIGDNAVSAYDLRSDTWIDKAPAPEWAAMAAYDPLTGKILVLGDAMWTYDVETDTWQAVDQGPVVPPHPGQCGFEFLDYDVSVDRVVLYTETCRPTGPKTWLYDPRGDGWARADVQTPTVSLFIGNDELIYDSANALSVVYAGGRVASYDATANAWQVLFDAGPGSERFHRGGHAYGYDPLNARLVVVGGDSSSNDEWRATDDVVAFDVLTRQWIELLAPSGG